MPGNPAAVLRRLQPIVCAGRLSPRRQAVWGDSLAATRSRRPAPPV